MNAHRQVLLGILAGALSSTILFGSLAVSLLESGAPVAFVPLTAETESVSAPPAKTTRQGQPSGGQATTLPALPTPANCQPPSGWYPVTVTGDETLEAIAAAHNTAPAALQWANCLGQTSTLIAGSVIYVPPLLPTATYTQAPSATATYPPSDTPAFILLPTSTSVPCGPPRGWVAYTVRRGDTLYGLSLLVNVTVRQLQLANCLGSSSSLRVGQVIYLPYLPPPSATPYRLPTATRLPPTATATVTLHPTATSTSQPVPTTALPPTATIPPSTATPTPPPATIVPTSPPPETPTPAIDPFPLPTATVSDEPTPAAGSLQNDPWLPAQSLP